MDKNYDVKTIISKYPYFKRAWSSYFCSHHQNCNHVTMQLLKQLLKTQEKFKKLEIIYQNPIYMYFLDVAKFANFR